MNIIRVPAFSVVVEFPTTRESVDAVVYSIIVALVTVSVPRVNGDKLDAAVQESAPVPSLVRTVLAPPWAAGQVTV